MQKKIIGCKKPSNRRNNAEIESLSKKQKDLRKKIECSTDKQKRTELKQERNKLLKAIHKLKKEEEENVAQELISDIEKHADDSRRMFDAVRILQRTKTKKSLIVESKNGIESSTKGKIDTVTNYFKEQFINELVSEFPEIEHKN